MAELLTLLAEAFVAVLHIIAAIGQLLLEVVVILCRYLFSKSFREKKRDQWTASPRRKHWEIGLSVVCLAALVVTSVAVFTPSDASTGQDSVSLHPEIGQKGEDVRVKLQPAGTNATRHVVVVKEGGIARIVGTRTITDLVQQVKADVSVVDLRATNINQPIEK